VFARPLRLALLWLALVLFLGSASFGPQQTGPVVRRLVPWMSASTFRATHAVVRKVSHFVEYAVLGGLWLHAFRSRVRFRPSTAAWAALAMCLACAVVDETHQTRVPGRHGSPRDVVLDSLGAMAGVLVIRSRKWPDGAAAEPSATPVTVVRLGRRA
jgi:VanZ family protein